ncbi:MAG: hypothetical protein N3E37_03510 [Candidatus Micrarchaeota archaeon]|nr:hypothetical protein [Candidatus Micrarchaeota archaeon]
MKNKIFLLCLIIIIIEILLFGKQNVYFNLTYNGLDNHVLYYFDVKENLNKVHYENYPSSFFNNTYNKHGELIYLKIIDFWPVYQVDEIVKRYENNISIGINHYIKDYQKTITRRSGDCESFIQYTLINYSKEFIFNCNNNNSYKSNFDSNYITFFVNLTESKTNCTSKVMINASYKLKEVVSYSVCKNNVCSCYEQSIIKMINITKEDTLTKEINTTEESSLILSVSPIDYLLLKKNQSEITKIMIISSVPFLKINNINTTFNISQDLTKYKLEYLKINNSVYKKLNLSKLFNHSEYFNFVYVLELNASQAYQTTIDLIDVFGRNYTALKQFKEHDYSQKNKKILRHLIFKR